MRAFSLIRARGARGPEVLLSRVSALLLATALAAAPGSSQPATARAGAEPLVDVTEGLVTISAPSRLAGLAGELGVVVRQQLPRLEEDLGQELRGPTYIVLLPPGRPNHPGLARIDAMAPAWAAGFLAGDLRLGAIRLGQVRRYPYDGTPEVLAHELTHMLLHDATEGRIPRWLGEGISTFQGSRRGVRDFAVATRVAMTGSLPALDELDAEFEGSPGSARRAYSVSADFVTRAVHRHGPELIPRLLDQLADPGTDLRSAWLAVTGESLERSELRWRRRMLLLHRWLPALAGSGVLWIGISGLAVLAGIVRRRRLQQMKEMWDEEDRLAEPLGGARDDDELVH